MADEFRHNGVVESVEDGMVRVRILQSSACSGCQVKSLCKVSESKEKLVDVACSDASRFEAGQKVSVIGTTGQGMRAVLLAFTIPLVLLLAVIVICKAMGTSDAIAAVVSISTLVPYYLILFLCRNRIGRKFQFRITDEVQL